MNAMNVKPHEPIEFSIGVIVNKAANNATAKAILFLINSFIKSSSQMIFRRGERPNDMAHLPAILARQGCLKFFFNLMAAERRAEGGQGGLVVDRLFEGNFSRSYHSK